MPDSTYPDTQVCKKCSLYISEGHAYELGDDRWHIHCFKCSKCDNSLGCNSNFLILGDGNLICLSCSYNCKQCGKKIDDLAILTGDQAYCSSCFKCRVCKLKIEDLRYARTSKGLFCMSCHEKLIAKKRKYDMKRKQMAHLELLLKPHPGLPSSADSPLLSTSHGNFLDIYLNYHNSSLASVFKDKALPNPNAPRSTPQRQTDQASKDGIEEVNDSDDELNIRRAARNPDLGKTHSQDNILELIESFSGPNTPLTEDTELHKAPPETKQPTISTPVESNELRALPQNDTLNYATPRTETLPSSQLSLGSAPRLEPALKSPQKELLLLSPSQYNDKKFHNTTGPSLENLGVNTEEITRRSAASSPMARVNRQARVVETNDDIVASDIGLLYNAFESSINTTPKKSNTNVLNKAMASPPPRSALPNVPATPKRQGPPTDPFEPRGLGLENVELLKPNRVVQPATPAVTNLEESIDEKENTDSTPQSFGRRNTFKGPKNFLKHKRSTSSGLGSGKFGGLFKSKDDQSPGHARHVSDGSINHHLAFTTPPLPLSSPMKYGVFGNGHNRSSSDTHYVGAGDLQGERQRLDTEMRQLRMEINLLEGRKSTVLSEIVKLGSEKNKLNDSIAALKHKVTEETEHHELILQNIHDLVAEKRRLVEENQQLKDANSRLKRESKRHVESPEVNATPLHSTDHNDGSSSSLPYEGHTEDPVETQKATRLRFWRKPKVHVAATNSSAAQSLPQTQQGTPMQKSSSSNSPAQHSNGSETNLHYKLSQSYSSNAIQHPSQFLNPNNNAQLQQNQQQPQQQESGPRKAFNSFMSRSRSTNILDSFVGQPQNKSDDSGDVPLLSSTIQKRAKYEDEAVPLIITKCIEEVEKRGLDMEGIYRISGGNSAITAILNAFLSLPANPKGDKKHMNKLAEVMEGDIHAVTSALKRYLRKLPEPLIPFACYDDFVKICKNDNDTQTRCDELVDKVVNKLPAANRHTLYLLSKHLDLVGYYNNVNRMTMKNLSVVLAPTIAWDPTGEREMTDMGPRNDTTELLLLNFSKVFANYEV
ncbi:hypothetical protein C7M61_001661 [Candidozyma pseudohaemuli]|uniref:Rho-type GTPase-activating protein 1 n=1 Tax=Candidozyma pseudohaemuli TaxID=418784 RepID=A0A2P7YV54_9ASCO|nr:hypothetical protein C7M61_001661 [[Candida] pseudohaemulonii]PSK39852.1 hypothetical protein C7M61_001661 [[Candida] pseudohaemulonii]